MRSLAKALIIIVCIICGSILAYLNHFEFGLIVLLFGGLIASFYEHHNYKV